MNRTKVVLGLGMVAALAGLGGLGHAATLAHAAPRATAAIERCHTGRIYIDAIGGQGAAGHIGVTFRLRSLAASPCAVYGYPGMQMLTANGQAVPTHLRWGGTTYLISHLRPQRIILAPGGSAFFSFDYEDNPTPGQNCPAANFLQITPPDEYTPIVVPVRYFAPCGGQVNASPLVSNRSALP